MNPIKSNLTNPDQSATERMMENPDYSEPPTYTIYICSVCGKHQPGASEGSFNGCHTGRVEALEVVPR